MLVDTPADQHDHSRQQHKYNCRASQRGGVLAGLSDADLGQPPASQEVPDSSDVRHAQTVVPGQDDGVVALVG